MTVKTEKVQTACWDLKLLCDCPYCNEKVDLLDLGFEFYDGRSELSIGKPYDKISETFCPNCGWEIPFVISGDYRNQMLIKWLLRN